MIASPVIPFTANYRRFTPAASALLMRISTALGTIRGARVLPAVADQLRASAKAGTVHYSNLIEGNELPFIEAERATRGVLDPDSRAKIELINYVAALDLIDDRLASGSLELTPAFLKELHGTTMEGLGREDDDHFKPHHEGEWRDGTALVVDRITQRVMYEAPPPAEVPSRMEGLFEWLDRKTTADEPAFVLAGVAHYGITDIHPFADGNGRAARLFQAALLMKNEVLPGRMFSFERYYADDRERYYTALRSVRERTLNMETWLEYFLAGLAEEYERVATTVTDLSALVSPKEKPLLLTQGQERGLATLRIEGKREFNRREYEKAAGVGRGTAQAELRGLLEHGVLVPRGSGPSTRYAFSVGRRAEAGGPRPGPKRRWTDARIERELRAFLADRDTWPTPAEFREHGHGPLYLAASRAGGITRWRTLLGL